MSVPSPGHPSAPRRITRSRTARFGVFGGYAEIAAVSVLGLAIGVAILPGAFAVHDPATQMLTDSLVPPGAEYWLGTDGVGRDVLSRLIHGTRTSLYAATLATTIGVALGVPAGLLAGYVGGPTDAAISGFFDGLMSIPAIILAVTVVAILGPGLVHGMSAVGVIFSCRFFRVQRGATIATTSETYIEACEAVGCSQWRILWRHILPNSLSATLVQLSIVLGIAIIVEASLSFLGLGAQPPTPSWGSMLSEAFSRADQAPYLAFPPGIAITLTVLSLSLVSNRVSAVMRLRPDGGAGS